MKWIKELSRLWAVFTWTQLFRLSKDLDVGLTEPSILFVATGDASWVQRQRTAVVEAFKILDSSSEADYLNEIRIRIKQVILGDTGEDKYEPRLGYVYLKVESGTTDNPHYLASRLVHLSTLMAKSGAKPWDAVSHAYERQLEFLALLPDTEPIRGAILEKARLDGINL